MAGRSKKAGQRLLVLKHNVWWFRREIPEVCREAMGKGRYYLLNLRTSDLKQAQAYRDELESETAKIFADIRAGVFVSPASLSARDEGMFYREAIVAAKLDDFSDPDCISELEILDTAVESRAEVFRNEQDREAFSAALLGKEAIGAHLEAHLATMLRNGIVARSVAERGGLIRRFIRWADQQKPVPTVERIDRRFAGRYVAEVLDRMNHKTQSKHLMALRGYWIHLCARGVVELPANEQRDSGWPWNNQQIRNKATRAERGGRDDRERPFSEDELSALLYSPYPKNMTSGHKAQIEDALRISLLSGMRMAEVLTLWIDDVKPCLTVGGLIFDIQEGKTDAAARPVPVHTALLEIIERRLKDSNGKAKASGTWLFDELCNERSPRDVFGKRFKRYRVAVGVDDTRAGKRRSLTNFHSARRWFATQAARAGQSEAVIKDLLGHEPDEKNVTRRYIDRSSAEQLRACVESVNLPLPVS